MDKNKKNEKNEREERVAPIMVRPNSLLDRLLDPENRDPIKLISDDGEKVIFEQIATIPGAVSPDTIHVLLHPLTPMDDIGENEAVVFRYVDDENGGKLSLEEDEDLAERVYYKYLDLLHNDSDGSDDSGDED